MLKQRFDIQYSLNPEKNDVRISSIDILLFPELWCHSHRASENGWRMAQESSIRRIILTKELTDRNHHSLFFFPFFSFFIFIFDGSQIRHLFSHSYRVYKSMIKVSENLVSGQSSGPELTAVASLLCAGDEMAGGGGARETALIISDWDPHSYDCI